MYFNATYLINEWRVPKFTETKWMIQELHIETFAISGKFRGSTDTKTQRKLRCKVQCN